MHRLEGWCWGWRVGAGWLCRAAIHLAGLYRLPLDAAVEDMQWEALSPHALLVCVSPLLFQLASPVQCLADCAVPCLPSASAAAAVPCREELDRPENRDLKPYVEKLKQVRLCSCLHSDRSMQCGRSAARFAAEVQAAVG